MTVEDIADIAKEANKAIKDARKEILRLRCLSKLLARSLAELSDDKAKWQNAPYDLVHRAQDVLGMYYAGEDQ